jgi:hypothetical protein
MVPSAFWPSTSDLAALAGPLLLTNDDAARAVLLLGPSRSAAADRDAPGDGRQHDLFLYLLHFPIQLAIALGFSLAQQPIPYQNHLFWAAFVLPTLIASQLTYRYFEAPAQRLIAARCCANEKRSG